MWIRTDPDPQHCSLYQEYFGYCGYLTGLILSPVGAGSLTAWGRLRSETAPARGSVCQGTRAR